MRCQHEWSPRERFGKYWSEPGPATEVVPGAFICMRCGATKCEHEWRKLYGYKRDLARCAHCGKPKVKGPPVVRADDHELHRRLSYNWLEGVLGREMDSLLEMQIQHDLRDVT